MNKRKGNQTVFFDNPPVITAAACVAGKKEGEGPLAKYFDKVSQDALFGEKTWEQAESKFVKQAIGTVLAKSGMEPKNIDYIVGGDLINQCTGTTYGIRDFGIPSFGVYGACSTMGLSMSIAAMCIDGSFAERCIAVTSSHFCTAEKQFRLPIEYGGQRPPSAQRTVTGSGCVILEKSGIGPQIQCITTGKIVDMGIKDANNMGAAMAPAAADTLTAHFEDTKKTPSDYDLILTGDLGFVGKDILIDLMKKNGFDLSKNYNDCGLIIFDSEKQDTHAGGSGCGCSALVFCSYAYSLLSQKKIKSVLFMPTGALQSTLSVQQGESIPAIAHAVSICT